LQRHRPRNTWFGRLPVGRIDHVFVSRELEVMGVTVPRNQLSRLASDHLPLIVDLRVPRRPEAATPAHSPAKLATI
jgi:endonuclease/exonuclease/phosphatase family metal-dependent hydrolase